MDLTAIIIAVLIISGFLLAIAAGRGRPVRHSTLLNLYSKDLTRLASQGKLDPVVGREREIKRVIQILSRRTKNNPVLIGESGVGKTAIVEGLANRIASGDMPESIKHKRLLQLDLSSLIAGTKYRGEFEKRLKGVVDEIISAERNIIIFIDELHILAEAGEAIGAIDAADILKPALARGELQAIGASTRKEYDKRIATDVTLERRFQPVTVREPDGIETKNILKGLRPLYEKYHQVRISDESIDQAILMSEKVLVGRYFPDKAIDILDEAAAMVHLEAVSNPKKFAGQGQPIVMKGDVDAIINEWSDDLILFNNPDINVSK